MLSYRIFCFLYFFFNDTATTEIYTLSLHDALPICHCGQKIGKVSSHALDRCHVTELRIKFPAQRLRRPDLLQIKGQVRSEEHTSELQSRQYLVCRLLLEKKKKTP